MSKTFDRYAGVLFLLIGAAFIIESQKLATSSYGSNVGPDILPTGLGIILILLSLRLLYETFTYKPQEKKRGQLDYKRFLPIFGAAIVYVVLLEPLGYVITTFLFLTFSFQVMERGGWIKTLIISGAFSYGIYYLFVHVLEGTLPGFPI